MKAFIGVVLAAGLGTVVAAIWVGSTVREEQVVDHPYETGLGYDTDRAARASLGWTARVEEEGLAPGPAVVRFSLRDGAGAPLEGAVVKIAATRPETSRDRVTAQAHEVGGGRYEGTLAFAGPGPWALALEVSRGADRLVLERSVRVQAGGTGACDLAAAPCTRALADGRTLTLDLGPRPLRPFVDLAVTADLRDAAGRPVDGADLAVSFEMPGMFMGENRAALPPVAGVAGRYAGKAVLVRCPSGRRGWRAEVTARAGGSPAASAAFDFQVAE